jgi:hypothetical protein
MFLNKIIPIMLILIISSCELTDSDAGGPELVQDPPTVGGVDLIEPSSLDYLKDKFSQADLSCMLWFQKGEELDMDLALSKAFTWDLINDFSLEKEFTLVEKIDALANITVIIKPSKFEVLTGLVNKEGDVFEMAYSPVISMNFTHVAGEELSSGVNISNKVISERSFKQNTESVVVYSNKRTLEGDVNVLFTHMECNFKTTAI